MRGINFQEDWSWANTPRGKSGSSGTNTVVQQSGPPQQVLANYQQVYGQAQNVANQPYPTYDGSLVAGFTPQQEAGFNNVNTAVNAAQPFLDAASQYTQDAATGLSPDNFAGTQAAYTNSGLAPYLTTGTSQIANALNQSNQASAGFNPQSFGTTIQNYMNPYQQSVIAPTQALFNEQNAQQQNQVAGSAASAGAFGGDRQGVAQAVLAGQQQTAEAPVLAGLESSGYQQAVSNALQAAGLQQQTAGLGLQGAGQTAGLGNLQNTGFNGATSAAQANQWLQSQAGFGFGNLANEAQTLGLQGANAQLSAGAQQQQQAQQELNAPYQQFLAAQGYPYQATNFLNSIATGTGSLSGTQGSTTSPGPSALSQIAGTGLAGAGLLGQTGAFGANGWLSGPGASSALPLATEAGSLAGAIGATTTGADAALLAASPLLVRRGGRIEDVLRSMRGIHIPRRDGGGAVSPAQTAMFSGNPLNSNLYSLYSRLPTEKLQELAARSPQNTMVTRALQMRQMTPQADPQQTPGLATPAQTQSAPGGFADGGWVHRDDGGGLLDYDTLFSDNTPALGGMSPSSLPNDAAVNPVPGLGASAGPMPDVGAGIPTEPIQTAGLSIPIAEQPTRGRDTGEPLPQSATTTPTDSEPVAGFGAPHASSGPWNTLIAAGLGILGGTSPHAGVNIGQGGLKGLEFAEQQKLREQQQQFNTLYRQGLLGVRGQGVAVQQQRANTADRAVDVRDATQNRAIDVRQATAARAQELKAQGMDDAQANAQARLDIARGNAATNATYKGTRLGQIDEAQAQRDRALDQGAQRIAQSKEANDARLALTRAGQDATGANADIGAASRMVASGAVKDFPTALKQVQTSRTATPRPASAAPAPTATSAGPPPSAVDYLKAHPELAPQFKQKYGVDPSQFLGQ